ncbi:hypothetical protein SAMN05414139_02084 [Burkholderia sp. D7]|nr:hypothetical protein SAMN05414139_02084 [Burkholderia sp. D7]
MAGFTKKYSARKSPLPVWHGFSEQAFAASLQGDAYIGRTDTLLADQ